MEEALVALYAAAGGPPVGVALACVGSLARSELGPRSDLDLVLLHDGSAPRRVESLADDLWYPVWDARFRLDHAVRTPGDCAEVAGRELSAGVALLDLRRVAGDPDLVASARGALLGAWRTGARRRLPELLASLDERAAAHGTAAYLLEPDLKEARGGFRDAGMLRALAATWLTDRPHTPAAAQAYERLLDVRDALHVTSGRAVDRLVAAETPEVAARLGYDDSDALRRAVSLAARHVAHAVDVTARAARAAWAAQPDRRVLTFVRRERRPVFRREEHGLIVHAGEVGLDAGTNPTDPLLGLRAGALAARQGLMISPVTADNLGIHAPPLPTPWPAAAREAWLEMLSTGPALVGVWESLDLAGCLVRWVPAWASIASQPQHNPVHVYTVDRHSVQTVVEASRHLTQVERPDVLLLACLFHDLGKGAGGGDRHAAVGAPLARAAVQAMGLDPAGAELVERLVAEHLTLVELATRRDHADPATVDALVAAVDGRLEVLNLLRRLSEADARAAGPAAWTPWRAGLVNALADQVEGLLVGEPPSARDTMLVDVGLARSVALDGRPRVTIQPRPGGLELVIAARDRLSLFADTAGLLGEYRTSVRSALLATVDGVAVTTWRVDRDQPSELPDPAVLAQQLDRLAAGDPAPLQSVTRREQRSGRHGHAAPWVRELPEASATATVVEVRAADRPGLLFALGRALAREGLSIRSAHVSTLAGQAIDTFYVTEPSGARPGPGRARRTAQVLESAARGAPPPVG